MRVPLGQGIAGHVAQTGIDKIQIRVVPLFFFLHHVQRNAIQ